MLHICHADLQKGMEFMNMTAMRRLMREYGTKVVAGVTPGQRRAERRRSGESLMIARTPGLVAHLIEEQTREKPMRRIDPVKHVYDGPAPRSVG